MNAYTTIPIVVASLVQHPGKDAGRNPTKMAGLSGGQIDLTLTLELTKYFTGIDINRSNR